MKIAIIGFGEAGQMFGKNLAGRADIATFDIRQDAGIQAKAQELGVQFCLDLAEIIDGAYLVMSLVTADAAPEVARAASIYLKPEQVYLEMNSLAPSTKQSNAKVCKQLVDIAIMAPVYPQELNVPLLIAHPDGEALTRKLNALGLNARFVGKEVGKAASIKMCRSVMIKGMEALTLECFYAARYYGIEEEIKASLHNSFPGMGWKTDRVDYWFERVTTHGARRAAEMREVAKMVADAGIESQMALETSKTQALFAGFKK